MTSVNSSVEKNTLLTNFQIRLTIPLAEQSSAPVQQKGSIIFNPRTSQFYISDGTVWNKVLTSNSPGECIENDAGDTSVCTDNSPSTITFTTSNIERGRILPSGEVQFDYNLKLAPIGVLPGQTGELKFCELLANGSDYLYLKAPDSLVGTVGWTLPSIDGAAGNFLQTNGLGVLSWSAGGGTNFADNVFYIFHNANPASQIFFNAAALAGNIRTFSAPNSDGVLPMTDASNNLAVGETNYAFAVGGSDNTFIGRNCGNLTTTGQFNTAQGTLALGTNSTGSYLTAFGTEALRNATTFRNTCVGTYAGRDISTGIQNVAIGDEALTNTTTGNSNTAIGSNCLFNNLGGLGNTACGQGCCFSNSSGLRNSAFGSNALHDNSLGSDNCAFGQFSLNNCTVSNNSAFGQSSLSNNTIGTSNCALGRLAGSSVTTGSDNLILGHGSDVGAGAHSGCIVLGSGAITTASGQMVIKGLMSGTVVLVAGTIVVATTLVTASTRILLTTQIPGGVPGFLIVSARTVGVNFTILSSSGADTSTVSYFMFEP